MAAKISRPVEPVPAETPVLELAERFRTQSELRSVAVIKHGIPVGVIRRHAFLTLFTNPFSHALYAKRRVEELIEPRWLMARHDTPLEQLSQQITDTDDTQQEDVVIVDDDGHYLGMGRLLDLLREITAIQVRCARHANPLTGLPGNIVINDTMATLLASSRPFVAAYCDIDAFKAYNDTYGYARGDSVILALANILQTQLDTEVNFLGHVGGDDFMLLLVEPAWRNTCEAILENFAQLAPSFYDEEHRQAGGLWMANRQGVEVFHPLLSLSIGAQPVPQDTTWSPLDISSRLSELKHRAKQQIGNSLFVDRRHP
ncbi:GGDEF domain-containing protein [Litchfieldella xinjiangensis]|uniref:GGDEF domain-containing protein n=1 Tax=Litchfieldella xinjiangensis TaxID=1166948 RepID=UPI002F35416D